MTAFAAVVREDGTEEALAEVAAALGGTGGADASATSLGSCTLLLAPLHHEDPAGPVVLPAGIGLAGQVLLEGRRDLAAALREPAFASSAALAAAAYTRWGDRCTEHLRGEFAFGLWDANAQTLLCARDGMGLRLLYVADSAGTLIVTNVLAAALRHPAIPDDPDDTARVGFLAHGGAGDPVRTPYRHVKVLPPGHTLVVDTRRGASRMFRHWHFPVPDGSVRREEASAPEAYRAVLAEAVRDRTSERGTSIFVSGGIDSTTIAAAACEAEAPGRLHAVTARYPRYEADGELRYTRAAVDALGLPLTVIEADRHEPWHPLSAYASIPEPLDEPMLADWRAAVACAAEHGTVALYGEDGDILFRPPGWRALRRAQSIGSIGLAAARYVLSERRRPYLGLRWRERLGLSRKRRHTLPAWLTPDARALLERCEPATILGHVPEALAPHPTRPATQEGLTATTYSRDFALMIAPEVTRQRIELRFPLFDTRVVQFVISLPAIPWSQHKALPRLAYRGRLPRAVLDRRKTTLAGFNEAMVAAWRKSSSHAVPLPGGTLSVWIDRESWTRTLQQGSHAEIMEAWRVLGLHAWMASPRTASGSPACIP